jgi:AraC family transcriptional regulator of adaptative response / DNA-3-methyladenine glycosylase II
MRALGDPDAFLATDLGVRAAARTVQLPATPAALTAHAASWRPWRAYATQYLWASGDHPINRIPTTNPPLPPHPGAVATAPDREECR